MPFLVLIGHPGWSQYLSFMPFPCATLTWLLSRAICVSFRDVPSTEPKFTEKLVEAIGETRDVILLKVVPSVGRGAS